MISASKNESHIQDQKDNVASPLHTDLFILWSYMCKTLSCRICYQRLFCQIQDLILTPPDAAYNKGCYKLHPPGPCGPCNLFSYKDPLYYQTLMRLLHKEAYMVHIVHAEICKYVFRQVNARTTGQVVSKLPSFAITGNSGRPLSKEVAPPQSPSHCL